MRTMAALAVLATTSCSFQPAPASAPASTPEGAQARKLIGQGARLLDVRTPSEFAGGHIEGALNIPVDSLEGRLAELEPKDKPVVVYCLSGHRSKGAAQVLRTAGFTQVLDLGSIRNW